MKSYDWKYIFKKVLIFFIIFVILSFFRSCKVNALTVDDMSYGSKVYFLDFRGGQWGKNYNIVTPNFGTEYMVYYQTMTSATYGIGAGVYLENALIPSNTYRVTYLWAVPTGGCSIYDWNQFGVLNNLSDSGQQNLASRQVPSIDEGLLEFDENITLNVCVYSATFVPDTIGSALVLPMKSRTSTTEAFVFWGFVLEDAGNGLVLQSTINDNFNSIRTQNQTIINQNTQINNSINDVNDSINDDSVDSADSKASEWASKSLSTNAVANMVTMPITLLQAYLNGLNGSCSSFSLGSLYDHELTLPCINLSSYFGSTLWGVIDILFSGFMIYALGKKFVKIFNDFTNLRDNQVDELYGGGN